MGRVRKPRVWVVSIGVLEVVGCLEIGIILWPNVQQIFLDSRSSGGRLLVRLFRVVAYRVRMRKEDAVKYNFENKSKQ